MKDFQEFEEEFKSKKILPIHTIEQLVQSHLVAEVLDDIKKEVHKKNTVSFMNVIPKLDHSIENIRAQDLYNRAVKIFKFKPVLLMMLKISMEDMFTYSFEDDSSITTAGSADTQHLSVAFGSKFTDLSQIDLLTHTLNVFEEALNMAEHSGRGSTLSYAILGALMHDFGKSTKIKSQLLGNAVGKGYKPHAEISHMYVSGILMNKLYNLDLDGMFQPEVIDSLANIVKNHHPGNAKLKADLEINFVVKADHNARKKEFNQLRLL